jgi:hypothetical protein
LVAAGIGLPLVVLAAQPCTSNDDCSGTDACIGGGCVPPVSSPDDYAVQAASRWSSYVWTIQFPALFDPPEECCFDYTGDGVPDDQFGAMLALAAPFFGADPAAAVQQGIEDGALVKIFDWRELAPDLLAGDVQLSVFDGEWNDAIPFDDRRAGLGHTMLARTSFGPYGAIDQLNSGSVDAGLVEVTGNGFSLVQPFIFGGDLAPVRLRDPRLQGRVVYDDAPGAQCWGLCTVDEDRGPGHTPQIVGGAKLGGVIPAEEFLEYMDTFFRGCACAGVNPNLPVIVWQVNPGPGVFEVECTDNTGDPSQCPPDDLCAQLDTICDFIPIIATTLDIDHDGDGVNESYSIGLRLGFSGNSIDGVSDFLFGDGFESGDTSEWSNVMP